MSSIHLKKPKHFALCALVWTVLAFFFVVVGIATDFWFTGTYKIDEIYDTSTLTYVETTAYFGLTYGLERVCVTPSDFYYCLFGAEDGHTCDPKTDKALADDLSKKPSGSDFASTSDWHCGKWDDIKASGKDFDDCQKGVKAGLGFGIMGVIVTAPIAVIMFLWVCCYGMLAEHHKLVSGVVLGLFGFAVLCFLISPAVVGGQCHDENENLDWKKETQVIGGTPVHINKGELEVYWSLILSILGLISMVFASVSYCAFYKTFGHHEDHCNRQQECAYNPNQQPVAQPAAIITTVTTTTKTPQMGQAQYAPNNANQA